MDKKIFFSVIFLFAAIYLSGQKHEYTDRWLNEENGLPQNFVYTSLQDKNGFLWVGTGNGLARYDGNQIYRYDTLDGLSENIITSAVHANDGTIYFGHFQGGISKLEGLYFKPVDSGLDKQIVCLRNDPEYNKIWGITRDGALFKIDVETDSLSVIYPEGLKGQVINSIALIDDKMLIGTSEGLLMLSGFRSMPEQTKLVPFPELEYISVNAITLSENGKYFWAGTDGYGIYKGQVSFNDTLHIVPLNEENLRELNITTILTGEGNNLWVGTNLKGLFKLSLNQAHDKLIRTEAFNTTGIHLSISHLLTDDRGNLWVSSKGNGICTLGRTPFTHHQLADTIKATTINSGVYLPVENSYLLGTDQGLLKGQYQPEINDYVFGQLPHLASGKIDVSFMYKQSDSLIWISTKAQGNYVFNPHTDALKKLTFNDALGDVEFRDMAVEQNGQIWISVKGQGVFQLDQNLRILKNLNTTNGFIHNEIYAICPDNEGNIWFGSREAGLVMLDKAGQLIYFTQQGLFPSKSVNDIIKDAQGNIWIATNGEGLFTFRKGEFYNLKKKDGLLSDFCDNLTLIPEHQSLWVKHRNGLSQIDPDDRILTYSTNMNFSDNSLDKSVFFNGDNNSLWLNEKSKLIRVATLSLQRTTPKQKPKITGVSFSFANENEINFSERGKRPVFTPENLELSHEADHLTFRFVAIAYQPFHKNYYRYKLLGFEQNWSPVTENNTATYTNLKPGNYTLQVMSTNNPKNWIKSTTEYNFHIIKPYWEEWWFYMGQIIVFIMLFLITYNMSRYSKNRKRDKWILRLMVYVCLFIMFEYLQTFLEPYTTIFTNGVPVFKLMINLILALVLFPVEAFITTYFYSKSTTVNHIK